jgi:hypothetical protein
MQRSDVTLIRARRARLRHGCGYALANAGHDTRAIQDWLGRPPIQHTVRYTGLAPDRLRSSGATRRPRSGCGPKLPCRFRVCAYLNRGNGLGRWGVSTRYCCSVHRVKPV